MQSLWEYAFITSLMCQSQDQELSKRKGTVGSAVFSSVRRRQCLPGRYIAQFDSTRGERGWAPWLGLPCLVGLSAAGRAAFDTLRESLGRVQHKSSIYLQLLRCQQHAVNVRHVVQGGCGMHHHQLCCLHPPSPVQEGLKGEALPALPAPCMVHAFLPPPASSDGQHQGSHVQSNFSDAHPPLGAGSRPDPRIAVHDEGRSASH